MAAIATVFRGSGRIDIRSIRPLTARQLWRELREMNELQRDEVRWELGRGAEARLLQSGLIGEHQMYPEFHEGYRGYYRWTSTGQEVKCPWC